MAMSFFGKLKSLHTGPPTPPRRTENNAGWPQEDFQGEEEGDMYEAPPCERVAVKVAQRQVEDNVYLERSPNPAVAQRQAAPPPTLGRFVKSHQHAEDPFNDPQTRKPPEIDRNEKPGRKKLLHPPVHSPPPTSDEDVYLDPNEEQEEDDDVYLEPTDACIPAPRGPMRTPPSPQTQFGAPSLPMAKSMIPRAKSSSILPLLNEVKTATVGMRRGTLPSILPPRPAPGVRPPLAANVKEAKVREDWPESSTVPARTDVRTGVLSSGVRTTKLSGNEGKEWFAGDCNRKTAEALLLRVNKDGAFLIRHSSAQSSRQPYTLAVLFEEKVYNIPIRYMEELRGFALGKEGKTNEEIFSTLDEMISYHQQNQLLLIDSRSQAKRSAYLTHPARP